MIAKHLLRPHMRVLAGLLLCCCAFCVYGAESAAEADGKPSEEVIKSPETARKKAPAKIDYAKLPLAQLTARAEAGDAKAQFELGSRLNYGRGIPKDTGEALHWLRRAGESGHPEAQRLLALKFYSGTDVPTDHVEAFQWTARLADAGDVPGQLTLANMYANGEGIERSLVRAHMWYNIAAANAGKEGITVEAEKAAQAALELREKTAALLLPEQEQEAQRLAGEWWLQKQEAKASAGDKPTARRASKPARRSAKNTQQD